MSGAAASPVARSALAYLSNRPVGRAVNGPRPAQSAYWKAGPLANYREP